MVAVVNSGESLRNTFFYNEHKLASFFLDENGEKKPCATLLAAVNYPMDLDKMNQQQRLNMLVKTAAKRASAQRPSIHISLNFAPGEKLSEELLRQITQEYMEAIGFGDQPYLMYRHDDAGHPHVHIVSLRVRPDGTLIDTYNIGAVQSRKARLMLEEKYNLVRAEKHEREVFNLAPVNVNKAIYGRSATKRAITNVLDFVLKKYKYSSLSTLNAILQGYNIRAERGSEQSRTYKNNGLVYHLLSPDGKPLGKLIPASHFYLKPTLKFLEEQFKKRSHFSPVERTRVKTAVDFFLKKNPAADLDALEKGLLKQKIRMVIRRNAEGRIYGLTYVDFQNKCAFKGSDLGTEYSSNAIQKRCRVTEIPQNKIAQGVDRKTKKPTETLPPKVTSAYKTEQPTEPTTKPLTDFFEALMAPENVYEPLPYELRRKKRKKRK